MLCVLALGANAYALFTPNPGGPTLFAHADKIVHALLFAGPACLAILGGWRPVPVLAGLTAYGIASEVIQARLLAERSGSVWDLLADAVGIACGVLVGRRAREWPYVGGQALGAPIARDAADR